MIKLLKPGWQSLIQDLGRAGYRHLGISQAGALDRPALLSANLLVGNPITSAGLEICGGGLQLEFEQPGYFALAGAYCQAYLDTQPVYPGFAYPAQPGQQLKLGQITSGFRCYLAVSGGILTEPCLGSRSTDLNNGFGGLQGRALQAGDRLFCHPANIPPKSLEQGLRTLDFQRPIRLLPGPEWSRFDASALQIYQQPWQIRAQSNRMGYRLKGPKLRLQSQLELRSEPIMPGLIQVPPDGTPILLLNDAQTLGGYPRLASVIYADLWRLAQYRPGDWLHFELVDIALATQARHQHLQYLQRLQALFDD